MIKHKLEIVSEYDQEIPHHKLQTNPWHSEEEPHNNYETPGRHTQQSNQPSYELHNVCVLTTSESRAKIWPLKCIEVPHLRRHSLLVSLLLIIVAPIVCGGLVIRHLLCDVAVGVLSSLVIILLRKRE